jgi:hypothetical protein
VKRGFTDRLLEIKPNLHKETLDSVWAHIILRRLHESFSIISTILIQERGNDVLSLKQVFKEIHLFEERRLSKEAVDLALQVEKKFQNPPTSLSSSNNKEKKKFVREECENGVHNPKATHKEENCFAVDLHCALLYFQKKQAKNVTTNLPKLDNLKTFAVSGAKPTNEIVLDSGVTTRKSASTATS